MNNRPGKRPGSPKSGGRQKGTPNKINSAFAERVRESGKDVVGVMLEFLDSPDEDMRFAAAKELLPYLHPKLRATEHSVKDGESSVAVIVSRVDLEAQAKQLKGES